MPTAARLLQLASDSTTSGDHTSCDAELLRRYTAERDEAAFAELVRRNGPLVLRACRHIVGEAAADDAFQTTFLLLVRSARRLTQSGSLAGWLHATAVRVANNARRGNARRVKREAVCRVPAIAPDELSWREVREVLDRAIAELSETYRLPLVLCYILELSYEEAARRAGCTVGALRGRLERGKERLRKRLTRYGLPLAAPVLILGRPPAVSAALVLSTLECVRTGWANAVWISGALVPTRLKAVLFASVAAVGVLFAAAERPAGQPLPNQKPTSPTGSASGPISLPRTDPLGESLPPGAVMRLGTRRFQVQTWPLKPVLLSGGKHYLTYHTNHARSDQNEFQWMDTGSGVVTDRWAVPSGQHAAGVSADGRWAVIADTKYFTTGAGRARPEDRPGPVRPLRSDHSQVGEVLRISVRRGRRVHGGGTRCACLCRW